MGERNFMEMLKRRWEQGLFVCVGLDSELTKIPKIIPAIIKSYETSFIVTYFNCAIVDQTANHVCAYKINRAFYDQLGIDGLFALKGTIRYIKEKYPEIPIIMDSKRGDIGNTNEAYAKADFDEAGADAVTVHPYTGRKSMEPFLKRSDKGVIILCCTSNEGNEEFQGLPCKTDDPYATVYKIVAKNVAKEWNYNGNCAIVVGATHPVELQKIRRIVEDLPILIPGIGAQGGDLEETIEAGHNSKKEGVIINLSRSVIFASPNANFAEAALQEVLKTNTSIKNCLNLIQL